MSQSQLLSTGIPSEAELVASPGYPQPEDLARGPIAVIECLQEIPCNPCEAACPRGAIMVGEPITNLPHFEGSKCTGCGLCIAACPGQAVFVVHRDYSPAESSVSFPFEYLPLPESGSVLNAINRAGEVVCKARVLKVLVRRGFDRTAVITIAIPRRFVHEVRGIERSRQVDG